MKIHHLFKKFKNTLAFINKFLISHLFFQNWIQVELKLKQLLKNFNKKQNTFEIFYEKIPYIFQCYSLAIFKQSRYEEAETMINQSLTYLMANKSHFKNISLFLENILCTSLILYKTLFHQENFENARKVLQR